MNVIAPTLTLEQAARCWQAVVVGAGPAGAVLASELARRRVEVLLVDRAAFPRSKVCGSCLNGRALGALSRAGMGQLPSEIGAVPVRSFHLVAGTRSACVPLPAGVTLSRQAFDAALVRSAIAQGAAFLPLTRAMLNPGPAECRRVGLEQGSHRVELSAKVVLAADGLGGTLLGRAGVANQAEPGSRIGIGVVLPSDEPFYRPGVIYMNCAAGGYVGLVRLEDGQLDVACAVDPEALRAAGGPGALAAEQLERVGWPVPEGLADAPWRGTPALTRQAGRVADHRLLALGDATGYVEPFTGEGMAWALTSAVGLADLAARAARDWNPGVVLEWTRRHRQIVTHRQLACRMAAFVLRRPWLTGAVVALLARVPGLARPVVAHLNHPMDRGMAADPTLPIIRWPVATGAPSPHR